MIVNWSAGQRIGQRDCQEDYYAVLEIDDGRSVLHCQGVVADFDAPASSVSQTVLILADGMGGMGGMGYGDVAAHAAVEACAREYRRNASGAIEQALRDAVESANQALARMIERCPDYKGMGCTLVVVVIDHATRAMQWLSLGDSPLWLYRGGQVSRSMPRTTCSGWSNGRMRGGSSEGCRPWVGRLISTRTH